MVTGDFSVKGGAATPFALTTPNAPTLAGAEGAEVIVSTHAVTLPSGSIKLVDRPAAG